MNTYLSSSDEGTTDTSSPTLLTFDELKTQSKVQTIDPVRATALVFEDPVSKDLLAQIERIAPSDATVLVIGETGTGKELVARQIHALSQRHKNSFGALNCAALTESLIESELFGYEKGSFTGAASNKQGWFENTNNGTLFLDEIGDLPLSMQSKLLRVLQEREVVRVGSRQAIPVDVRIIAATNVNLEEAVTNSKFRADLYYRFNVATLYLAPLRDRPRDILPLAKYFIKTYSEKLRNAEVKLTPAAELTLLNYDWPGNIRELENAVHRALLVTNGNQLRPEDFQLSGLRILAKTTTISTTSLESAVQLLCEQAPPKLFDIVEETVIRTAFEHCQNNQVQTANLLNISRNVLRTKLALYGLLPNSSKHLAGTQAMKNQTYRSRLTDPINQQYRSV